MTCEFATWKAHAVGSALKEQLRLTTRGHASRAIVKRGSTLRSHLVPAVVFCKVILLALGTGSESCRSVRGIGRMSNGYSVTISTCDLVGEGEYMARVVSIS